MQSEMIRAINAEYSLYFTVHTAADEFGGGSVYHRSTDPGRMLGHPREFVAVSGPRLESWTPAPASTR